jgi:hypothetical protein
MSYTWDDEKRAELARLFQTARVALANDPEKRGSRYHQRLWAAAEYSKAHPECSSTAAYKELDRADAWRGVGS